MSRELEQWVLAQGLLEEGEEFICNFSALDWKIDRTLVRPQTLVTLNPIAAPSVPDFLTAAAQSPPARGQAKDPWQTERRPRSRRAQKEIDRFIAAKLQDTKRFTAHGIWEKVAEVLCDALGIDDDEVIPEATMVGDLGAESIDFLDIVFRLEKYFNIEIPRSELFPEDILTSSEYVSDGKVTSNGLAELRKRMPFADLKKFEEDPVVQNFGNMLCVADLCRYVNEKRLLPKNCGA